MPLNAAPKIQEGHNVKRIREILGIKQHGLAIQLSLSQQAISQLEQKETLGTPTLDKIANALGVSADAIRNFNEEATFNINSNSYPDHSSSVSYQFNPIKKIVELYREKIALYQRMLKEKDALIEKLMQKKLIFLKVEVSNYTNALSIGRKIEGVRRLRGMTQTQLGGLLGVSKQAVSKMEQTKQIDDGRLNEIAKAFGVTVDAILNFSEEVTFNIVSNTYHNLSSSVNYQFNPIEKMVAMYDEKIVLYEQMIKVKNELIDKLVQQKK